MNELEAAFTEWLEDYVGSEWEQENITKGIEPYAATPWGTVEWRLIEHEQTA